MIIIDLLKRITSKLSAKNIDYMLTGSIALNHYSLPRMTLDIDMVIELNKDNIAGFLSMFGNDYYYNLNTIHTEIERKGMFNLIDHKTGLKIDFIIRKESEYKQLEFSRRIRSRISDFEVFIVSPEDLIIAKIEWIQQLQSDKHITDIKNLLEIPGLDIDYVMGWCTKLDLITFDLI